MLVETAADVLDNLPLEPARHASLAMPGFGEPARRRSRGGPTASEHEPDAATEILSSVVAGTDNG